MVESENVMQGTSLNITTPRQSKTALKGYPPCKDEFIATLAHELRNPLAPISNAVELLGMPDCSTERVTMLTSIISRQVKHMTRLIEDLLDVSCVGRDRLELRILPIFLNTVVDTAVATTRGLFEIIGQQLTVSQPDESLMLKADPTRLVQALVHLLNNASKFSPPSAHIWLTIEKMDDEVLVRVRDQGLGIAPSEQARIFDTFTQIVQSLDHPRSGLGIGLTLTKMIVEMHGGTVKVHSEGPGCGSEFIIRLPLLIEPSPFEVPILMDDDQPPTFAYRILVAEDVQDSADLFAQMLRRMGHQVFIALTGPAAFEQASIHQPNVIFSDIAMPGLSGYELAERLRRQPLFKELILIALTGLGQPEDRENALRAGFDYYLVKPAQLDALHALFASIASRESKS